MYGTVRTVVWEDGGGDPASYPILGADQSPRYSQPLVQVSWMRTRDSSGSKGLTCCQIHLAST